MYKLCIFGLTIKIKKGVLYMNYKKIGLGLSLSMAMNFMACGDDSSSPVSASDTPDTKVSSSSVESSPSSSSVVASSSSAAEEPSSSSVKEADPCGFAATDDVWTISYKGSDGKNSAKITTTYEIKGEDLVIRDSIRYTGSMTSMMCRIDPTSSNKSSDGIFVGERSCDEDGNTVIYVSSTTEKGYFANRTRENVFHKPFSGFIIRFRVVRRDHDAARGRERAQTYDRILRHRVKSRVSFPRRRIADTHPVAVERLFGNVPERVLELCEPARIPQVFKQSVVEKHNAALARKDEIGIIAEDLSVSRRVKARFVALFLRLVDKICRLFLIEIIEREKIYLLLPVAVEVDRKDLSERVLQLFRLFRMDVCGASVHNGKIGLVPGARDYLVYTDCGYHKDYRNDDDLPLVVIPEIVRSAGERLVLYGRVVVIVALERNELRSVRHLARVFGDGAHILSASFFIRYDILFLFQGFAPRMKSARSTS